MRQHVDQSLSDSLASRQPVRFEAALQVEQGAALAVQMAVHPLDELDRDNIRVRVAVEDVTDIHQLRESLRLMATKDPLTGLRNRRGWIDLVTQEVNRAKRTGQPLALMDLDDFKRINDTHGHDVGEILL